MLHPIQQSNSTLNVSTDNIRILRRGTRLEPIRTTSVPARCSAGCLAQIDRCRTLVVQGVV